VVRRAGLAGAQVHKVLIANRGEISVRVARACRDAGIASVAVYSEHDLDALHVRLADEAYALGGQSAADSYLHIGKLLAVAGQAGADAVHPGYGFLSENAEFARAVVAAGLTWIGPPAAAIEALGDKVAARRIARKVGAPLAAGTEDPVRDAGEVAEFAERYGLPVAIKAAFGGGGRGLKVARAAAEIPGLYESAVRESVAAFGRAECFAERYLDRARHVEAQCLADRQGNVVVVSTRDCTLQRRHQKLVEEAPAPFLSPEQDRLIRQASKAILREAGYVGAGTCEFLIGQDGAISFLEVNARLQVEHPVTEEVTGIDLVREQFRIALGEPVGYPDPEPRGHSIEFRINAEDAGRGFLPAPGPITGWQVPSGPGVRLDAGFAAGMTVPRDYDSLLGKLIITGATRRQALERARRALAEFTVDGLPTLLPFHRVIVDHPAFIAEPFTVHTRWIETEFANTIPPHAGQPPAVAPAGRQTVTVEIDGRRVELSLPAASVPAAAPPPARRGARAPATTTASGDGLFSPMQGTIVQVLAANGAAVRAGETVVILEAMKMEQPLTAHKAGTVAELTIEAGQPIVSGAVICQIRD
jgi:acetyl-CoA/propionyl-CoA carboxylase, biotin carboxylase, biotin carboxyl carrier protein